VTGELENSQVSKALPESLRKLVLFLVVGSTFAVAYSILCTFLVKVLPGYPLTIGIGVHAFLIPFAFFAQRNATFASSGMIWREFFRYAGLQIASISLSALMLSRLVGQSSILNLLVFLSISAFSAIASFAICNFYIFRTPDPGCTSTRRKDCAGDSN
jgi:putative flippase GtrA